MTAYGKPAQRYQYRLIWKRASADRPKIRLYSTQRGAERFALLLGDEPWRYTGKDPDAVWCCNGGPECSCGGMTERERSAADRAEMPPVEWMRIERRAIGEWEPAL